MQTLEPEVKELFRAKIYMDDVFIMMAQNDAWDHAKFLDDFKKEVYWNPLRLECGGEGTFLETKFDIEKDKCNFRLKNTNEGRSTNPAVWRYQHFDSYGEYMQKRSTLASTLTKVDVMASNDTQLFYSASEKLKEFKELDYPVGIRKYMCHSMAFKTENKTWFAVGKAQC